MQNVHGDSPFGGGPSPTPNPASGGFTPHSQFPQSQFPFLPQGSGYSQNPQTQPQGFHPSGLSFGSIQSMTGSNPNYAAGYNPTAMAMPPYLQMLVPGYNPGANMQLSYPGGSMVNPWIFNEQLSTVLHARHTCPQCDATVSHILMAVADNDTSYNAASTDNLAGEDLMSLNRHIGEMEAQLASERNAYDNLRRASNDDRLDSDQLRIEQD
ncbi:hypothetical protein BT96DRAFT_991730 [Gymnopus androsaceus JB14]|uniref:Uncharacterized protein n=1 Tax=Gymnopus androsaceus JB14 TaxID=1447944 RepID=A0A6A4HUN0_9AGAR|nr:hypothetical protein BT96DRAFT_991730 [Gymnopus androsaceus JB14]